MKKILLLLFLLSTIVLAECKGHKHNQFDFGSSIEANIALPEFDRVIGEGRPFKEIIISDVEVIYVYRNYVGIDIIHKNGNTITVTLNLDPRKCDFYKYYF